MNWKMIYAHHHDFITWEKQDYTIAGLESSGFPVLDATVPGNFELDLMRVYKGYDQSKGTVFKI